jgi:hypothetical protein
MQHPNTVAAIVTLALANVALYIAHRVGYVHLSQTDALNIAGALIAGVLFVGRRGLRFLFVGLWTGLWNGTPRPAVAAQPPAGEPAPLEQVDGN